MLKKDKGNRNDGEVQQGRRLQSAPASTWSQPQLALEQLRVLSLQRLFSDAFLYHGYRADHLNAAKR